MTDPYKDIKDFLHQVQPPKADTIQTTMLQATVDSVEVDEDGDLTCTVLLPDGEVFVEGCRWLVDAYYPTRGDCVWLIRNRGDRFILGRTIGTGMAAGRVGASGRPAVLEGATTTIANNAWSLVPATQIVEGVASFGPLGEFVSPSFTVAMAGRYAVNVSYEFATSASGERAAGVRINSTDMRIDRRSSYGTPFAGSGRRVFALSAGDVVQPVVWQNSGGGLDLTFFQMELHLIQSTV